jgi:hypothetical protein
MSDTRTTRCVAVRSSAFCQAADPAKVARWITESTAALAGELTERLGQYWLIDSHRVEALTVAGKLLLINLVLAHSDDLAEPDVRTARVPMPWPPPAPGSAPGPIAPPTTPTTPGFRR